MLISYRGVVDGGRVRLREAVTLPEGTEVIVTVLSTEVDLGEPTDEELAHLAMTGGAFDWLEDEPELYTDADLVERFPWTC
jgi:hypothetical protein